MTELERIQQAAREAREAGHETTLDRMIRAERERRMRDSRFRKGSGRYTCRSCGKQTRETGASNSGVGMCGRCYDAAGLENGHLDGDHEDGAVEGCPLCAEGC